MSHKKKIVVLGAGFAGISTVKALAKKFKKQRDKVEIILVNDTNYFLFTPLLHEVAGGSIEPEHIVEPIRKAVGKFIDQFIVAKVERVSIKEGTVHTNRVPILFDYLVVATGSTTSFYGVPGAKEFCFTLKNLEDAVLIKHRLLDMAEKIAFETDPDRRRELGSFAIIGGGPTGVELASEIVEYIEEIAESYNNKKQILLDSFQIHLIQRDDRLLLNFDKKIQTKAYLHLAKIGVKIHLDSPVTSIDGMGIVIGENDRVSSMTSIWVAGIKPQNIVFDESPEKYRDGRLKVRRTLQLISNPNIFILGDMAACEDGKNCMLPTLAQVASKQGPTVAHNISMLMQNGKTKVYKYHALGQLISLGQWMAAGQIGPLVFSGKLAWWVWRTVYLSKLVSWPKKFKVALDWTIDIFSSRDISRV